MELLGGGKDCGKPGCVQQRCRAPGVFGGAGDGAFQTGRYDVSTDEFSRRDLELHARAGTIWFAGRGEDEFVRASPLSDCAGGHRGNEPGDSDRCDEPDAIGVSERAAG